jgi:hypothetical protein
MIPAVSILVRAKPKVTPAPPKQRNDQKPISEKGSLICLKPYHCVKKTIPIPLNAILSSKNIQQRINRDFDHYEAVLKFTIFSEKVMEATKIAEIIVKKNLLRSKHR